MKLTINNQPVKASKAMTLLDVAIKNHIYIPTLCAHPELTPYGGCRLCIIEVEGRRGYPTACTTVVEDGMAIRTETQALQEMRRELIQLILSEHPSACLICEDVEGCTGFQETIRKVGVTTGCRWCPKDRDCELQRVVEYLEVKELELPGLYRYFPVEKYDPFFDRDYNLCIYCGRCVRICVEHRRSSVLSLRQRGKLTTIGPAFDQNHIDAGCEFCGACVSVCPTGAMSEKSKKWWGIPEKYDATVCPLCSFNCDLQVLSSKNKVIGTTPLGEPHQSGGNLCVKGRFCLSELVNRSERVLEPEFRYPEGYGIVDWDFALEKAKGIINEVPPGRSAVYLSPGLTLEEIFSAREFAEKVLKTKMVSSSCMSAEMAAYLQMASGSVTLDEILRADAMVSLFFNGNFRYAPLTMKMKEAAANGVPYYQVGWMKDTTSRFARKRIIPGNEDPAAFLEMLLSAIKTGKSRDKEIKGLAAILKDSRDPVLVIGPEILSFTRCQEMLDTIRHISKLVKARIFLPNQYGNLEGLLSLVTLVPGEEISRKIKLKEIDLLYLVGDIPYNERPGVPHIIYQNAFPAPAGLLPDLVLPASVWGENKGSYLHHDRSLKVSGEVAIPHGYALPHEAIFNKLARAAGLKKGLPAFKNLNGEKVNLPGYVTDHKQKKDKITRQKPKSGDRHSFTLVQEKDQHVYNGYSLGKGLEGLGELVKPGQVLINPGDASAINVADGETVWISSSAGEKSFRLATSKNIDRGFLYLITPEGSVEFDDNPCPVNIRRENV